MDTQKISSSRRWYDKKRFVLPALFLFFPLGLALVWMGEAFQKNVKIGITIFFSVMFVWIALSPKEPSKTVAVNEEKQEVVTSNEGGTVQFDANGNEVGRVEETSAIEEARKQLERELKTDFDDFDNSTYRNNIESLKMEVLLFALWAQIINDARKHNDTEVNKLADKLQARVAKLQSKEFPLMRKEAVRMANKNSNTNAMRISGKNNEVLEVIDPAFANPATIEQLQTTLLETIKTYRYKKTVYLTHKGQENFIYYEQPVLNDDDLIEVN